MRGGRYSAEGPEAEYEPGSRGQVLRNPLGVRSVREIAARGSAALVAATQRMIDDTRVDQRFAADDVRRMHRVFGWEGSMSGPAGETKRRDVGAVHAAMDRDYRPMTATFRGVIARSVRTQVTVSSARGRSGGKNAAARVALERRADALDGRRGCDVADHGALAHCGIAQVSVGGGELRAHVCVISAEEQAVTNRHVNAIAGRLSLRASSR